MRAKAPFLVVAIGLSACTPVEMRGEHRGASHVCHNEPAQHYLGRAGDAGAVEGARKASGAQSVRVLRPGEAMTMDFRPDRLTVTVNEHRIISRIACG